MKGKQLYNVSLMHHSSCPINFIITDCPSDESITSYLSILRQNNSKFLIRLCDPSHYSSKALIENGIKVIDNLAFKDGSVPSDEIVESYRLLTDSIAKEEVITSN
ncbi:Protein tyrosine phosphatase type IVA 1 [Lobulomyces angularis]|nr:Protein tyrosine phosphatase type IVA 1 [Lobulomyces angularis]